MLPNLALPEDAIGGDSSQVEGGAKATVEAYDHADFRLIATGALESVDNEINSATGTITLRATFAHDDEALCPNQFYLVPHFDSDCGAQRNTRSLKS